MALCYTQLKRHKEAIQALNTLLSTFLSPPRMIQVFTLLGDNHLELKDRTNALLWYGKGLLIRGQPHEELKRKIRALVDTMDTEEELNQVEIAHQGAYAGGYAKLKTGSDGKKIGLSFRCQKDVDRTGKGLFRDGLCESDQGGFGIDP